MSYGAASKFSVVQPAVNELPPFESMTLAQTWPFVVEAGSGLAPE
jgi:hypothetical protein